MKKPWLLVLLTLAVAALSVGFIVFFKLNNLMRSLPSTVETAMIVSLVIIAAAMCLAFIMVWRPERRRGYLAALAVMLAAGVAPSTVDSTRNAIEASRQDKERRASETKWLAEFDAYKKDVAARISATKPFSPREAQLFLDFVQDADLSYRSLPDHSPAAFALLKEALDGKILDPNVQVRGKTRIDVSDEPLFVVYYRFYLQSGATMAVKRVRAREWTLFQMLIAGGANLADPAAAVLRDVVKLETAPYGVEGWVMLK